MPRKTRRSKSPPATPAAAQISGRVLIIYGEDACPSSDGEEIVVCVRRDENERKGARDDDEAHDGGEGAHVEKHRAQHRDEEA